MTRSNPGPASTRAASADLVPMQHLGDGSCVLAPCVWRHCRHRGCLAGVTDDNGAVGEALIYIGYGELMRRLQVLEMTLWQAQSLRFKRGVSAEQAMQKLQGWDGATFGKMWGGMKS